MLRIEYADYETLRAHGEETYPNECCGVLLGKNVAGEGNHVQQIVRAGNTRTDSAHNRYNIAPHELVRFSVRRAGSAWTSSASTTRTPTIRRSGRRPTSPKPTGSAAPTSSPASNRAKPP